MLKNLVVTLSFSFIYLTQLQCEQTFDIYLEKFYCAINDPSIMQGLECHTERHGNQTFGYGYFILKEKVKDAQVRISVDVYQANRRCWNMFDVNLDLCMVLSGTKMLRFGQKFLPKLFQNVYKEMKRTMNVLPECPIKSNFNYTVNKYYINADDYPSNLREAKYRTATYYLTNGKVFAHLITETYVVRKKKT